MNDAPLPEGLVELDRPRFHPLAGPPVTPAPPPTPAGSPPPPAAPSPSPDAGRPEQPESTKRAFSAGLSGPGRGAIEQDLGDAAYGAVVILFGLAWIAHRWLRRDPGRQLREPSEGDYLSISAPLGRIAARHLPIDVAPRVALSVKDGVMSVGAARRYVARGPLLEHVNLEQPQEGEQPS